MRPEAEPGTRSGGKCCAEARGRSRMKVIGDHPCEEALGRSRTRPEVKLSGEDRQRRKELA